MVLGLLCLHIRSSQIQIRQLHFCYANCLFTNIFIRRKCLKNIFYNNLKCLAIIYEKIHQQRKLLQLDENFLHIDDINKFNRNYKSHLKLEYIFSQYKNNFKVNKQLILNNNTNFYFRKHYANDIGISDNCLNYILKFKNLYISKIIPAINVFNRIIKNVIINYSLKDYISKLQIDYLHNNNKLRKFSEMSDNNVKSNFKPRIKSKAKKKKRKLTLLLAGGCLSCKRSKRDEQKLTEEAEEFDTNKIDKYNQIARNISAEIKIKCSSVEIEENLDDDTVKDLSSKTETIYKESENSYIDTEDDDKILTEENEDKERSLILAELPFRTDICSEVNIDDSSSKEFFREKQQKKKKKEKLKDDKSSKKRPNYFVAIQVCNSEIKRSLKHIQNKIIQKECKLKSALINLQTLHITLLVCHISNDEELERACSALSSSFDALKEELFTKPLEIGFEGIDNFNNKVIFVKIIKNTIERLAFIAEEVMKSFESFNIEIIDKKKFNPHVTILKLSKDPKLWKKGIKHVDSSLYNEFKDEHFGTETVKSLQLLDMRRKDNNGYYYCCKEVLFDNSNDAEEEILKNSAKSTKGDAALALQKEKENLRKKISALTMAQLKK